MARSALDLLSIEECKPIIAEQIKTKFNVEVNLASQTHQVPQVGLPQIDPVNNAYKVKLAPIGAADFNNIPEIFTLQTIVINPHTAMNIKIDWPNIAEGTCM